MTFTAPVADQLFALKYSGCIDELAASARFADATPDMVEAIVDGSRRVRNCRICATLPHRRHGGRASDRWCGKNARWLCRCL